MKRIILIATIILLLLPNLAYAWTISADSLCRKTGLYWDIIDKEKQTAAIVGFEITDYNYKPSEPWSSSPQSATTHKLRNFIENNGNILILPDSIFNNGDSDHYGDKKTFVVTELRPPYFSTSEYTYPWETYTNTFKAIIPRSIINIDNFFRNATPLECVEVHNNLPSIGYNAFKSSGITTMNVIEKPLQYNKGIVLPDNLKTIGPCAFQETPIRKVYFNSKLKIIYSFAFANCDRLKEVDFNPALKFIGQFAFFECDSLKSFTFPPKITEASRCVLWSCNLLEKIDLNNVTTIDEGAFRSCSSLNNLDFKNVTTIGNSAFKDCILLNNLDFKNVKTVGNSAFESCTSLSSLNLRNVSSIGNRGFYNCKNLNTIDLSKVDSIGKQCFEQCDTLQSVNLKKGMKIGSRAFYGCKNLNKIDLGRISYLGDSALAYCNRLDFKKLDLTGIDYVGRSAFLGNNIGELYIPKTTKFGYRPFGGSGISKVAFEQGRDSIPNDFLGGAKVVADSIRIPEGIIHIGKNAFEFANTKGSDNNRSSLPTLILPSTLKSMESYVLGIRITYRAGGDTFGWRGGQRVLIPHYDVDYIDHVSRLIILAETPPDFTGEFTIIDELDHEKYIGDGNSTKSPLGCQTDIPIYVPNGTIEAYKSAEGWNKYTNYHEMSELTGINSVAVDDTAEQGTDDGIYYDLQGRKVTNPQKGVYIHQGKKVMIK